MSSKKTVLITGCSDGGLGAALALAFHKANWRVLATARNVSKMASLQALKIETLELDVQSEDSLISCIKQVEKLTNGKLDMLINNAGGGYSMPVSDSEMSSIRSLFELNVFSVIRTIQHFLPLLLSNPTGTATIVNNTSVAGIIAGPLTATYNATKAALASYTQSLRLELVPFNIKVVDLKTAAVKSQFFKNVVANDHQNKLPADSIYAPARDVVEKILSGVVFMDDAMDASIWARRVVNDLSGHSPPREVSRGKGASLVWWVTTFFPTWVADSLVARELGMPVVADKLKKQKQKQPS